MEYEVERIEVNPRSEQTITVPNEAVILEADWRNPNRIIVALLVPKGSLSSTAEKSVSGRSSDSIDEADVSPSEDDERAQNSTDGICGYVKDDDEPCQIPSDDGYCHHHG